MLILLLWTCPLEVRPCFHTGCWLLNHFHDIPLSDKPNNMFCLRGAWILIHFSLQTSWRNDNSVYFSESIGIGYRKFSDPYHFSIFPALFFNIFLSPAEAWLLFYHISNLLSVPEVIEMVAHSYQTETNHYFCCLVGCSITCRPSWLAGVCCSGLVLSADLCSCSVCQTGSRAAGEISVTSYLFSLDTFALPRLRIIAVSSYLLIEWKYKIFMYDSTHSAE